MLLLILNSKHTATDRRWARLHSKTPPTKKTAPLTHLSGAPLRGGCTQTPNGVGPNRPHLSFCSEPFGLEQRTLGIASVPQGTKQFIACNGERACSTRQAEARRQQQQHLSGAPLRGGCTPTPEPAGVGAWSSAPWGWLRCPWECTVGAVQ